MLEGAAILDPYRGAMYDNGYNPTAACASGCVHFIAITLHDATPYSSVHPFVLTMGSSAARTTVELLETKYGTVYNRTISGDNDAFGREYVLERVRQMLQEA